MNYIAEVTAEAATGEVAHLYEQIRRLSGGPLVTLIYRHLATYPGALRAVWQSVSPLLECGELQEGAWKIACDACNDVVPNPTADLRALGAAELERAGNVLDAYNRANPVNYAVVCSISAARTGDTSHNAAKTRLGNWIPPVSIPPIAPIPNMDALDAHSRALVDSFGKGAGQGGAVLVPTLYRNIAYWPPMLELAVREVKPRLAHGAFNYKGFMRE
ncbi:MAG: hypothetical protein NT123_25560 [Proteobacteria bacterium]|nr:hypothetical protein [Pseudomonadota bacterium]